MFCLKLVNMKELPKDMTRYFEKQYICLLFQFTHLLWHNFVAETWLQAAKYIEYDSSFSEEEKKLSKTLKIASYLNNAACKLKLKEYKDAEKLCTKVLNCFFIR